MLRKRNFDLEHTSPTDSKGHFSPDPTSKIPFVSPHRKNKFIPSHKRRITPTWGFLVSLRRTWSASIKQLVFTVSSWRTHERSFLAPQEATKRDLSSLLQSLDLNTSSIFRQKLGWNRADRHALHVEQALILSDNGRYERISIKITLGSKFQCHCVCVDMFTN